MSQEHLLACWCGNTNLIPYSPDYVKCAACGGTLIAKLMPSADVTTIEDDDANYYGRRYWFEHQENELQQPTILSRARTDLSERVIYWTRTLLRYKNAPSRVFELGSGHGGFMAVLDFLGYDATGSELSPSIVELAHQLFDITMNIGSIEQQNFEPASFDAIVAMDVLEHLTNPSGTIEHAVNLLKPDGILFAQTPSFPEHLTYEEMIDRQHPFLRMMIPYEHVYLFSKKSVAELLRRAGAGYITFETPIFADYDMFFIASHQPIITRSSDEIQIHLESSFQGRLIQAMLDLYEQTNNWFVTYQQADLDRTERQKQIDQLGNLLQAINLEHANNLELLQTTNLKIKHLQEQLTQFQEEQNRDLHFTNKNALQLTALNAAFSMFTNYFQGAFNGFFKAGDKKQALEYLDLMKKALMTPDELDIQIGTQTRRQKQAKRNIELMCVVVDLIPLLPGSENGGAKVFTLHLIKNMINLLPACKFILLTSDINHSELAELDAPNTIRYCVYQRTNPLGFQIGTRLISLLERQFKVDLLFCPFTVPIYKFPSSVPVVSVIYDLQHLTYPEFFSQPEIVERDINFQTAVNVASKLVCISDYVRQTVLKNSTVPEEKVDVIHLSDFHAQPALIYSSNILQRFTLTSDSYLLYPANFWQHKNHRALLTAFSIYRNQHPDSLLKLVCTGTPSERMQDLQHDVTLMHLADSVVFPGYVSHEDFGILMSNAYALIFPSLYEGFGMPVLEAMAAGKPVMCSNVTSLPEIVGDAAILFDPRKPQDIALAIERLVQEPGLITQLIKRGMERAELFGNAETVARQYIDLFRNTLVDTFYDTYTAQGIYADGWVGETLTFIYPPGIENRIFRAVFTLPTWLHNQLVTAVVGENEQLQSYTLSVGEPLTIERVLDSAGGRLEIEFYQSFSTHTDFSKDPRSITCHCLYCHVRLSDQLLELFPKGS